MVNFMLCIFHQNNVFKKTHRWKKVSRIFGTLNKNAKVTLWSSVCILPCRHLSELTSSTSLRKLLALCHDYSSKKAYLFWVFVNFGMNFQGQYFRLSSVYNPGDHCPPPFATASLGLLSLPITSFSILRASLRLFFPLCLLSFILLCCYF